MQRLIFGLLTIGLFWTIGLAAFITALPQPDHGTPEPADGVIVYTGGGGARIVAGMSVFANGGGQRLLISGVHPDTTRARLSELWDGGEDLFECCVDLGHEARSTEGNALEAANWTAQNEFRTVVLVTSDYHMPRAVAVTKSRLPNTRITPYAVSSGYLDNKGRPLSSQAWRKLAGEYTKYLLARVKALFAFVGL